MGEPAERPAGFAMLSTGGAADTVPASRVRPDGRCRFAHGSVRMGHDNPTEFRRARNSTIIRAELRRSPGSSVAGNDIHPGRSTIPELRSVVKRWARYCFVITMRPANICLVRVRTRPLGSPTGPTCFECSMLSGGRIGTLLPIVQSEIWSSGEPQEIGAERENADHRRGQRYR